MCLSRLLPEGTGNLLCLTGILSGLLYPQLLKSALRNRLRTGRGRNGNLRLGQNPTPSRQYSPNAFIKQDDVLNRTGKY
jgi:hypothetical protein